MTDPFRPKPCPGPRIRAALLVTATMLAGCQSVPRYPDQLPARVETGAAKEVCPAVAGTYADAGQAMSPEGKVLGPASLTRLLRLAVSESEPADAVELTMSTPGFVDIVSIASPVRAPDQNGSEGEAATQSVRRTSIGKLPCDCYDGLLQIVVASSSGGGGAPALVMLTFSAEALFLQRATDDSLIVREEKSDLLLIDFVIPLTDTKSTWYRFLPAAKAAATPTEK